MAKAAKGKSPYARSTSFKKGMKRPEKAGRKKGVRNRTTIMLKDAILQAATLVGQDGRGLNGLTGYLMMLAVKERAVYSRLLEKVLPMQLHVADETKRTYSAAEAVERLRERGLPVPPALVDLAAGASSIAHALNDQREDGETDDLDNRRDGESSVVRLVRDEEN